MIYDETYDEQLLYNDTARYRPIFNATPGAHMCYDLYKTLMTTALATTSSAEARTPKLAAAPVFCAGLADPVNDATCEAAEFAPEAGVADAELLSKLAPETIVAVSNSTSSPLRTAVLASSLTIDTVHVISFAAVLWSQA